MRLPSGHDSEHGVVPTDAGADLVVVLLRVTHLVKLRLQTQTNKQTKEGQNEDTLSLLLQREHWRFRLER